MLGLIAQYFENWWQ